MSHAPHPFVWAAALLLTACATRSAPPPSSPSSPLSPAHPIGVTTRVTLALDEDPPLPGEPSAGWEGLDPNATAEADAGTAPAHGGAHHAH